MTVIQKFDNGVHKLLMNPTFVWVQKMFHWNRFQLISFFSKTHLGSVIFIMVLEMAIFSQALISGNPKSLGSKLFIIAIYGAQAVFLGKEFGRMHYFKLLSDLSEEFERTGNCKLPSPLIIRAQEKKRSRPFWTCFFFFFVPPILFTFVPTIEKGEWRDTMGWIFLCIYISSPFAEAHLWDIDDVDPRDRAYLLGRQTAGDSI